MSTYINDDSPTYPSLVARLADEPGIDGYYYRFRKLETLKQVSDGTVDVDPADPVGYAADQLGLDNHATQATAGSRLTAGANRVSGDGVADHLVSAQAPFAGPFTMIVAGFMAFDPTQAYPIQRLAGAQGAGDDRAAVGIYSGGTASFHCASLTTPTPAAIGATSVMGLRSVIAQTWDGSTMKGYVNGVEETSATGLTGAPTTSVADIIGGLNNNGTPELFSTFDFEHVLRINRAMPPEEVAAWADFCGFDAVPVPEEITLSLVDSWEYPTVDGGARWPVPTGLIYDGAGLFISGDDGRENESDPTKEAGINGYTWVGGEPEQAFRYTSVDLGLTNPTVLSLQGITYDYDDDSIYAIFRDSAGSDTVMAHVDAATGTLLGQASLPASINGVMLNPDNDLLYTVTGTQGTIGRTLKATFGTYISPSGIPVPGVTGPDMLFWLGDNKALFTAGSNNQPGKVYLLDMGSATPRVLKIFTLTECLAIEGISYVEEIGVGYFYVNSDQRFHPATDPAVRKNMLMKFGPVEI
jgi:hypothetical protein